MIQVFTGTNDFARKREIDSVISSFVQTYGDMTLERIDASEIDFGRLLESVSAQPFLAERRMVLLRQVGANKTLADGIEQFLDSVSDSTDVVIDEQKFDKRLSLYKTLKKRTEFHEFNELDERKLVDWVVSEASARGGELKKNDALYLVQRAGTNQMALSHEIDKLLAHSKNIVRKVIDELVEPLPEGTTFQLVDAAFGGNKKQTLELYRMQRLQQVEPQAIMGLIAWQVHVLAVVKTHDKLSGDEIAKRAKISPFVVRKAQQLVRSKSTTDIKELVSRTVALDARLKSEMIDADDAVQYYLLSI